MASTSAEPENTTAVSSNLIFVIYNPPPKQQYSYQITQYYTLNFA